MKTTMIDWKDRIRRIWKMRHVKYGVPFILFIVGASFGLREVTTLRYEYARVKEYDAAFEEAGIQRKDPSEVTIEAVYEEIQKLNTDDWENVRIPRPWEDENEKAEGKTENS